MAAIIPITDFSDPVLDIYARLTENQLLRRDSPGEDVLRLITDDPLKTAGLITDYGLPVSLTPVTAVTVPDRPGGLAALLSFLADEEIGVEYMYSLLDSPKGNAVMIFRTADADALEQLLTENGIAVYDL